MFRRLKSLFVVFDEERRVFLISILALDRMAKTVGKRFSNVRYWRYIFTPLIFLIIALILVIVFTSDSPMTSSLNALTSSYRKNTKNLPSAGVNFSRR